MYHHFLDLVGNTPLIEFKRLTDFKRVDSKIYGKLEFLNPSGSVKDRAVKFIIEDFIEKGKLPLGSTIIEPTSGNTGIALAAICNSLGYQTVIIMPENMSIERQKIIKAYNAELILTKGDLGMKGAVDEAYRLKQQISNSVILGQFDNKANVKAHYEGTAVEIERELKNVDYIVAGVGSGGTITGIGKYFKEKNYATKIVAVEPKKSPLLSQNISGSHNLQGIGANFIPKILDRSVIDEIYTVTEEEAYEVIREVCLKEGFLLGISAGAAVAVALKIAYKEKGKKIVVILPDGGYKYLSNDVYKY